MNSAQSLFPWARLVGLVLVLTACATNAVEEARQRDTAESQVNLAEAYLVQQNDTRQAMQAVQKAIELDPKNGNAYMVLGQIHQVDRRWDQAEEAYQKVLSLEPKRAEAYYLLGVVRHMKRDVPGAIEMLRTALAQPTYLNPEHAHMYLGGIYLDQGRVDQALEEFRKAVDVQPELGEAQNALGYALLLKERPREAIQALSRAVRLTPTLVAAHRNLGLAYFQTGKREEAGASFRKVLDLAPPESPLAVEAKKLLADLGGGTAPPGAAGTGPVSGSPAAPVPLTPGSSGVPPPQTTR